MHEHDAQPAKKADLSGVRASVLGYTTLRLAIGMSMLIHGVARIPKIGAFRNATVKMFADSMLPVRAVAGFARITPFAELLIGVLVIAGLGTRFALALGGFWIVALIFGSTLIENYDVVGIQLIYSLIFFHLLQHIEQNVVSLDNLLAIRRDRV